MTRHHGRHRIRQEDPSREVVRERVVPALWGANGTLAAAAVLTLLIGGAEPRDLLGDPPQAFGPSDARPGDPGEASPAQPEIVPVGNEVSPDGYGTGRTWPADGWAALWADASVPGSFAALCDALTSGRDRQSVREGWVGTRVLAQSATGAAAAGATSGPAAAGAAQVTPSGTSGSPSGGSPASTGSTGSTGSTQIVPSVPGGGAPAAPPAVAAPAPVGSALAPATRAVEPVTQAAQPVTQPVTQAVQPVTQPVTQAVQPVTQPVTQAVQPVTQPVAQAAQPVADAVVPPVEKVVAPAAAPVAQVVDEVPAVQEVPVAGGLLG